MVNEEMYHWGSEPSAIRELFAYGLARKAQIGAENVFDFSLGNPSVPAPDAVRAAIVDLVGSTTPALHGYSPAAGTPGVRSAIAASLNRRFSASYTAQDVYMTCGAAASINIVLTALANPADEFIVIAPYFPEYKVWIQHVHARCIEVPACADTFQLDIAALGAAITSQTRGIIIDSPNNPVGVVYSYETLVALARLLEERSELYGHPIYLISDEPYREIVYDGAEVAWMPALYAATLVCYSYSKSLSLPGERIGYILVPPCAPDAPQLRAAVAGAARALGFVCAPVLFQQVIERCVDVECKVAAYAENRALLCEGLAALGYEYIEPQGAFYLWVRALEPDAVAFAEAAKSHELLIVPSDSFGVSGWVRIGYCVSPETITGSLAAFAALAAQYR